MMARMKVRMAKKVGLAPGTLVHVGDHHEDKVKITLVDYTDKHLEEREINDLSEIPAYREKNSVTWINFDGVNQVELLQKIGDLFQIHPLVLEDIVHTEQRPKLEDHGEYLFIDMKGFGLDHDSDGVQTDQISFILGKGYLLSFLEWDDNVFDPVLKRLHENRGKLRASGPDYLAHALMDAVVDRYFLVLESLEERMDDLEEDVYETPSQRTLQLLHMLKRDLTYIRKAVWPLREVISGLERGTSPLIKKSTAPYLRDLHDHSIRIIETVDTLRDVANGLLDIYLNSVSNRMNEIMKVLTVFASIFMPLSFFAGVYGMNFNYMPLKEAVYGFWLFGAVCLAIGAGMLFYFRRKGWL